jgi:para-nitrobenzyl esterase
MFPASSDAEAVGQGKTAARELGLEAANRGCAQAMAKYNRSAAYLDLYVHHHPYAPGVKLADQDPATAGAYHTSDIPYWFGTLDKYNMFRRTRDWQPYDRQLSGRMMDMLIALANTGSPSTAATPWPAWTPVDEQRIEFGDTVHVTKLERARMDWLLAHPPKRVASAQPERAGPRD